MSVDALMREYSFPVGSKNLMSAQRQAEFVKHGSKIRMAMRIRVTKNGTSVTPRYEVVAKMVYYIYDDTW